MCAFLGSVVGALSILIGIRYGPSSASRVAATAGAALAAQQAVVGVALARDSRARPLDVVDALTLSRGAAAALLLGIVVSGLRDRRGTAGWLAWLVLLPAVTLADWIDGPLARRRGATGLGRHLDLELDSWLSLASTVAATEIGGLSRLFILPSLSRYAGPLLLSGISEADVYEIGRSYLGRAVGMLHMSFVIVALAPFASDRTVRLARSLAPLSASAEIAALAARAFR